MNNRTRTTSRNAAIGVALLALSGTLLAADVVMSRAVQPEQSGASSLALAVPVASAPAAAPSPPAHATRASREPYRSPPHTIFAAVVVRHVERRHAAARARPPRRMATTVSPARKATGARPAPSKARTVLAVVRETRHAAPAPASPPVRIAVVAERTVARTDKRPASRPDARATSRPSVSAAHQPGRPRRAGRSAVEAAQYFAVKTIEAQTPGLEHVAAVTRKRGTNRLVVHIIAKTHDGTLVEFEVLRRNGIGFAVESKTSRFVALSAREKAASPAKRVAGR